MRYRYLDAVKALAIVMVVGVHVWAGGVGPVLERARADAMGRSPELTPADVALLAERIALGLAAVNLFFMASGAMLLRKPKEPLPPRAWGGWYAKRFGKLLPPFLAWSLLYLLFRWAVDWDWPPSVREALLLPFGTFYHLWFLYMLFGLYLITPAVLALRERWPVAVQGVAVAALLAVGMIEPLVDTSRARIAEALFGGHEGQVAALQAVLRFAGHLGLFWMAALLHERPAPSRWAGINWMGFAVVGTAFWSLCGVWLYAARFSNEFGPPPPDADTLPMIATSPLGLFGWLTAVAWFQGFRALCAPRAAAASPASDARTSFGWRVVERLSLDSFGIYVLHAAAVWAWGEYAGGDAVRASGGPAWAWPAATVAVTLATWLAVAALRRVPGAARLIP